LFTVSKLEVRQRTYDACFALNAFSIAPKKSRVMSSVSVVERHEIQYVYYTELLSLSCYLNWRGRAEWHFCALWNNGPRNTKFHKMMPMGIVCSPPPPSFYDNAKISMVYICKHIPVKRPNVPFYGNWHKCYQTSNLHLPNSIYQPGTILYPSSENHLTVPKSLKYGTGAITIRFKLTRSYTYRQYSLSSQWRIEIINLIIQTEIFWWNKFYKQWCMKSCNVAGGNGGVC
jgi:hypothetical protein